MDPSQGSYRTPFFGKKFDQICDEFEAAWIAGQRPAIKEFLANFSGPNAEELLRELLRLAIEYRCRQGEVPSPTEYHARFPDQQDLIEEVFAAFSRQHRLRNTANWRHDDSVHSDPSLSARGPPLDELPQQIGRYLVQKLLGKGGFGLVYLAYDEQLTRMVAIKVPHARLIAHPEDAQRYLVEARTVAGLDHPNIVPVYDVGSTPECPFYVVSKYIEGVDLGRSLRESSPSPAGAAGLVASVAEALHYAHKRGLVHRDIKPGNILIGNDGQPYVVDFGVALREEDVGKGPRYAGTPAYMSPEQARGEGHQVDGRSDVFSLGVVLYEMLAGRQPFKGDSETELLEQITSFEARPPRQINDGVPRELERICLKALSKRAGERYSTALDMADELRSFLAQSMASHPALPAGARLHQPGASHAPTSVHRLYLQGRYYWNKRTEEGLRKSIASFYQALDEEPTCALAWAGLADAYHQLGLWGHARPTHACPKGKSAALKAIELDDALGAGHAALAVIFKDYEWDFGGAERSFLRALELDPNHALAHQWYGECLACMGCHAEAIAELYRAQELEPLSTNISAVLGRHGFCFARQFDQAIDQFRQTIETDPSFWIAHNFLGWVCLFQGNMAAACNAFDVARQLDDNPETLVGLGYALAVSGQSGAASECLDALTELSKRRYVAPVNFGLLWSGLGDKDRAFTWLDKACDDHSQWLSEIHVDPAFDPLRSDPRFADLLRRMNIRI